MMEPEEIEGLVRAELGDARVQVRGDGRHFQVLVVTPAFEGVSRIRRHRMVLDPLRAHLDRDALHAISLRALTPGEHESEQQAG